MWFSERAAPTSWSRCQPASMPRASVTTTGSSAPRMTLIMAPIFSSRPATPIAGLQHAIDHGAGDAEVAGRVGQLLDLIGTQLRRDLLVLLQQIGQRRALVARLVAQLVNQIVRPIPPELGR